jgi:hypothetical protein
LRRTHAKARTPYHDIKGRGILRDEGTTPLSHSPPLKPARRSSSRAPGRLPSRHGCLHRELPVSSHHWPTWTHHHHLGPPPQPTEPFVAPPAMQLRRSTSSRSGHRPAPPAASSGGPSTPTDPRIGPRRPLGRASPAPGRPWPPAGRNCWSDHRWPPQGRHCEHSFISKGLGANEGRSCESAKVSRDLLVSCFLNSVYSVADSCKTRRKS